MSLTVTYQDDDSGVTYYIDDDGDIFIENEDGFILIATPNKSHEGFAGTTYQIETLSGLEEFHGSFTIVT